MKPFPLRRATLHTYSHLGADRRLPNNYELVTTRLLYYVERGFEVNVPLSEWYRRHQRGSPLQCSDWERFVDPRQTTYARYTEVMSEREALVDGLLSALDDQSYDRHLSDDAVALFAAATAPLRFAFHGMQMLAAYVGQMAPSGRITVAAAFQSADQLRRIQRLAYRVAQLRHTGRMDDDGRARWQSDPALQPLREAIERALVAWDFGEAFTATCLCLGPLVDEVLLVEVAAALRARGDYVWAQVARSLYDDSRWHRDWAAALARTAIADRRDNRAVLQRWCDRWRPLAARAAGGLLTHLSDGHDGAARLGAAYAEFAARCELEITAEQVAAEVHA